MALASRTSLVGRSAVLAELAGLLDEAAGGAGAAALVYGEAGIGKTRTLDELAALAVGRGFLVAWGRCTELDGVPPYWAWRQALAALAVTLPAEPTGRALVLAALVDGVDAVTRNRPLLLCLEDVHWADADTRWLLRGLVDATAGRALAVVASRRTAETTAELDDLPPRVHRLPLPALSPAQSVELAGQVADGALPDEALVLAARQAGGNPFFIRELVRIRLLGSSGGERVPRGVREVLSRRLARLPSAIVEVLTAAAVLGGDADLAVLAATVGQPVDEARELVERAVRAGLVEPIGSSGVVGFVHAVVREVLLDEAGPVRCAALHERAARTLEIRRPDGDEALALHWARVPGPDAATHALRHARAARDAARTAAALDQAVLFAELACARTQEPEDLVVLGDARARTGDVERARADLLHAAAAARRQGRVDVLARAALALAGGEGGFEVALHDPAQNRLLDEAARGLPPGGLRARVRARQAVATSLTASLAGRGALARAAVAEAEAAADDAALLHALAAYADMIGSPRHVAERRAVADRMLRLAGAQGDVNGELLARRYRLVALLEQGDFPAADDEIGAFDRLAQRTHVSAHLWYPPLWRGMQALLAGREADAETLADQVTAIGARAHSANAAVLATALRLAARWGRPHDLAELLPPVEAYLRDNPPDLPQIQAMRAWMAAGLRDREATARAYRPLVHAGFGSLPEDAEYLSGLLGCTEAALLLADRPGAETLVALLEPHAGLWIVDGIGAACWGLVAEWLARLADLLGRRGDAARWRSEAGEAYRRTGATGPLRRLTGGVTQTGGRHAQLRRQGGGWLVAWDGEQVVLPDLKGLHDLAALVSRPGTAVPATHLLAAGAGVQWVAVGADEVLDERARAAYRDRLRVLEDDIASAEAAADLGRAQRLRDEREFLLHELSAALGLGARPRRLGDDTDRARKAVTMRLRDAIARLERPLPGLARHLRASVHTGRECCYTPDQPVSWHVRTGRSRG